MGNHETFLKQKKKIDEETYQSLTHYEKRINDGYSRSMQRKDQIRLSA